jgi:uncharacterized protein with PQ loop repeat
VLSMNAENRLSSKGRFYIHGVIAVGAAVLVAAILELPKGPEGYYTDWLILAALTAISGSATVKLPSIPASLSVSETFVFTCVLLFGPPAGTLTVALDGLIISLWLSKNRKELHRILFNVAAPAISIWVASNVFFYLAGIDPIAYSRSSQPVSIKDFVLPLLAFTVLFFSINSWMIAFAVSFETGNSPLKIWRTNFMWLSLNFFCGASVAALLAVSVDPSWRGDPSLTRAVFNVPNCDGPRPGRDEPSAESKQASFGDHRDTGPCRRCKGPSHARTYPQSSAAHHRGGACHRGT